MGVLRTADRVAEKPLSFGRLYGSVDRGRPGAVFGRCVESKRGSSFGAGGKRGRKLDMVDGRVDLEVVESKEAWADGVEEWKLEFVVVRESSAELGLELELELELWCGRLREDEEQEGMTWTWTGGIIIIDGSSRDFFLR